MAPIKEGTNEHAAMLQKVPSGIPGFDEITNGGLASGRSTLVCGDAGAGKTMFGIQFLVRGATEGQEPGVFVAFEETEEDLKKNVASLGWDQDALSQEKQIPVHLLQGIPFADHAQYEIHRS